LLGSTPVTTLRAIRAATVIEAAAATTSDLIRIDPDWWFVTTSINALPPVSCSAETLQWPCQEESFLFGQ
jgi:hypothetical protein